MSKHPTTDTKMTIDYRRNVGGQTETVIPVGTGGLLAKALRVATVYDFELALGILGESDKTGQERAVAAGVLRAVAERIEQLDKREAELIDIAAAEFDDERKTQDAHADRRSTDHEIAASVAQRYGLQAEDVLARHSSGPRHA